MIVVIDLGVSNVRSVVRAFARIGRAVTLATGPSDVERASVLVLPGVGAFRDGMARLHELGLVEVIRGAPGRGQPVAGICLGMQLLAEESFEHGCHEGLGLIPGRVVPLEPGLGERVPNIGWCDLRVTRPSDIVPASVDGDAAYFVHSLHLDCADAADVAATIDFGGRQVAAAVQRERCVGAQFHPEKSQDVGLAVLEAMSSLDAVVAG